MASVRNSRFNSAESVVKFSSTTVMLRTELVCDNVDFLIEGPHGRYSFSLDAKDFNDMMINLLSVVRDMRNETTRA